MLSRFCCLGLLLASTACASITTGTSQAVSVVTEPAGAMCVVSRDGETLGVVNPTPGSLTVTKASSALTVRCQRPGHQVALATVASGLQPMTLGNLLIGGVIGLGVDAATGAINQYPASVALALAANPLPVVTPAPDVVAMAPIADAPSARTRRRR